MSTARIDPAAAAASLTERTGNPLRPDDAFAVYRLGRSGFRAAVVRRVGHAYVIVAERAAAIGGAEFDGLLLAYLSGRHPDAGIRLWSRVDDPREPADWKLRALLLERIARAREDLSGRDFTVVTLQMADVKLPLTRDELESSIEELIRTTADLLEEALGEAGVAPGALAGIVMAGGAARTPLAADMLRRRFGVEPVAAAPGAVDAEEPAPAPTRELPTVDEEPARRGRTRVVAVAAALAVVVAAGAAFASGLGDDDPQGGVAGAESAPASVAASDPTTATPSPSVSASELSEGTSPTESSQPDPEEEAADPTREETTEEDVRPSTESAATGTVPDLVGLSTADARQAVDEAGFAGVDETGDERGVFEFYDQCEVIGQQPEAGATRPLADTVEVTYSYSGDAGECEG